MAGHSKIIQPKKIWKRCWSPWELRWYKSSRCSRTKPLHLPAYNCNQSMAMKPRQCVSIYSKPQLQDKWEVSGPHHTGISSRTGLQKMSSSTATRPNKTPRLSELRIVPLRAPGGKKPTQQSAIVGLCTRTLQWNNLPGEKPETLNAKDEQSWWSIVRNCPLMQIGYQKCVCCARSKFPSKLRRWEDPELLCVCPSRDP